MKYWPKFGTVLVLLFSIVGSSIVVAMQPNFVFSAASDHPINPVGDCRTVEHNGKYSVRVNAENNTISNSGPIINNVSNGEVFFLNQSIPCDLTIQSSSPNMSDMLGIKTSRLPQNVTFTSNPNQPGAFTLHWPSNMKNDPYGITFTASNKGGISSSVNIIIAIENNTETANPKPTISFDRPHYRSGPEVAAKITVTDLHAELNYLRQDTVVVNVTSSSGKMVRVPLTESGPFTHEFVGAVRLGNKEITKELSAKSTVPTLLVAPGETVTANYGSVSDKSTISSVDMWLDRSQYAINDSPIITVVDPKANTDPKAVDTITVKVRSAKYMTDTFVTLNEMDNNSSIFSNKGHLFTIGSADSETVLRSDVGDMVSVTYGDIFDSFKVFAPASIAFDKPDYSSFNLAGITLNDVHQNTNSSGKDVVYAIIASSSDPRGIQIKLVETGKDSAQFVNANYLIFRNDASYQNSSAILAHEGDIITVRYGSLFASAEYSGSPGYSHTPPTVSDPPHTFNDTFTLNGRACGVGQAETASADTSILVNNNPIAIVNCNANGGDTDGDGICNNWEWPNSGTLRVPYNGITYDYGSETNLPKYNHKDVYVEMDYSTGYQPTTTQMNFVATKFSNAPITNGDNIGGIRLHYLIDDNLPSTTYQIWSKQNASIPAFIDDIKTLSGWGTSSRVGYFGTLNEWNWAKNNLSTTDAQNYFAAKRQVFHYAVFIGTQYQAPDSSGISELIGNDIIVSLGCTTITDDKVEATFMHELGHNLGLDHGGGVTGFNADGTPIWTPTSQENCKPNYISVMSYSRQFTDFVSDRTIDYSRLALNTLSQNNGLSEPTGLSSYSGSPQPYTTFGPANSPQGNGTNYTWKVKTGQSINWDIPSDFTSTGTNVNRNVNNLGIPGCQGNSQLPSLESWKDWGSLVLDFRFHNSGSFASGNSTTPREQTSDDIAVLNGEAVHNFDKYFQSLSGEAFTGDVTVLQVKDDIHKKFELCAVNVYCMLNPKNEESIIQNLTEIRSHVDGIEGGNPNDDYIKPEYQKAILQPLDNMLTVFKLDIDYARTQKSFSVYAMIQNQTRTINGNSSSVTSPIPTFNVTIGRLDIRLAGVGQVNLTIPRSVGNLTSDHTMIWLLDAGGHEERQMTEFEYNLTNSNGVDMNFPEGYSGIRIYNTTIVPEFPLVQLVMVSSFVAIVVIMISNRYRRQFIRHD